MTLQANTTPCRDCQQEVSLNAPLCPHCGAPRPAQPLWTGTGYEYKSQSTLFGLPLIHIAFGRNPDGHRRVATGVLAIGQFARGIITVAQFGVGVIFVGQCGLGLLTLAQFGLGLLIVGQFAAGLAVLAQLGAGLWGHGQFFFTPS